MKVNSILTIILAISLFGCSHSGYKKFYMPYGNPKNLTHVEFLKDGEMPQVFGTDNLDRDVKILISKNYMPIGQSSFNGGIEDTKYAAKQAQRIGATLVLANSAFTNTQTTSSVLFVPQTQTTTHSGNNGFLGTSTTQGSIAVPQIHQQRRYDQTAIYLVKRSIKPRVGIFPKDLTPELRIQLERNTGVFIDVVFEDSPAFYANILPGDVLISLNGEDILSYAHFQELLGVAEKNDMKIYDFTIIRNGAEKNITVTVK